MKKKTYTQIENIKNGGDETNEKFKTWKTHKKLKNHQHGKHDKTHKHETL